MKKVISLVSAVLVTALMLCPAFAVNDANLPTSSSITGLCARHDGVKSLTVTADAADVDATENVTITIYDEVVDLSDPTNGKARSPITFRTFSAENVISAGKLKIEMNFLAEKLVGKCAACIQIPNRGAENDWVRAWIEVPVTLKPNYKGATAPDKNLYAPVGFPASKWLDENAVGIFTREHWEFKEWCKDEGGAPVGEDVVPSTGYTAYAGWKYFWLLGDMDFDEQITVTDALIALRVSTQLAEPSEEQKIVGDMNFDDSVDIVDSLAILRVAAGLAEPTYME